MALRNVSNWADLNNALRDLFSFKDQYTTKNLDFHGRMIKNASAAVDPNDYVILSQLPTFETQQQPFSKGTGGGTGQTYDKITFGLANGAPAQVGSGFTPPYIWSLPLVGKPLVCFFAWTIAPTGAAWIVDIQRNGSSIFLSPITIPDGGTPLIAVQKSDFAAVTFSQKDIITPIITQVGATVRGQGLEVVVVCTV